MDYKKKYYALKRALMVIELATARCSVKPSMNGSVVGHCWGITQTALRHGEPGLKKLNTEWRKEMFKKYNEDKI